MALAFIDYLIIGLFLLITMLIGWYARKTAGQGIEGFFLGGKNLPWYLAGLSMVATTFAADTPLAVTELVSQNGIAGNWLWWSMLMGGMFTAVFYARLWRRSGVVTEAEFITLRYSGPQATWLKKFKAFYLGFFMNAVILAWVNLAFISVLLVFFNMQEHEALLITFGVMILVAVYSAISGLLGVVLTDAMQFFIALVGCIILAILVVNSEEIGGIRNLSKNLPPGTLDFFPKLGQNAPHSLSMGLASFLAFAGMVWWSSWYPGAEPGGGGYIAQRMLSTKDEKHSFFATLFFQFAHYGLRPWPWIVVALCSILLYPELSAEDSKLGFVMAMKDFLPAGMRGLLVAAFIGAYMSTVSTHLNWGASYIVNDILDGKSMDRKNAVLTSRITTVLILVLAMVSTLFVQTISGVWDFILQCGAGLGLLLMLRWFWFKINAWAEITATLVPFLTYGFIRLVLAPHYPELNLPIRENPGTFIIITGVTTFCWIAVALLTKPDDSDHLVKFKERIYPRGFETYRAKIPAMILSWLGGIVAVYSFLFLVGKLIFLEYAAALQFGLSLIGGMVVFFISARKSGLYR